MTWASPSTGTGYSWGLSASQCIARWPPVSPKSFDPVREHCRPREKNPEPGTYRGPGEELLNQYPPDCILRGEGDTFIEYNVVAFSSCQRPVANVASALDG